MPSRHPQAFDSMTTLRYQGFLALALGPVLLVATALQGWRVPVLLALGVGSAWLAAAVLARLAKDARPSDLSAPLGGALLVLLLPANAPFALAAVGGLVSVLVVRGLLGRGGTPWISPVLVAWAFLQAGWPQAFTVPSGAEPALPSAFDSQATEWLNAAVFSWVNVALPGGYLDLLAGVGHPAWAPIIASATLPLLAASVVILGLGLIPWEVPSLMFLAFTLVLGLLGQDLLRHVLAGTFLLCVFFLATDPSSRPLGRTALVVYSLGAGLVAALLRLWGTAPDGAASAVLLMNLTVPWLEQVLRRKSLNDFRLA